MNQVFLKYKDKNVAKAYFNMQETNRQFLFKTFLLFDCALVVLQYILLKQYEIPEETLAIMIIHLFQLLLNFLAIIFSKKLRISVQQVIIWLIGIINIVIIIELYNKQDEEAKEYQLLRVKLYQCLFIWLNGITAFLFMDFALFRVIYFAAAFTYTILRLQVLNEVIISFAIVTFLLFLVRLYLYERQMMMLFQKLFYKRQELDQVKVLIKDQFFQGVLIISKTCDSSDQNLIINQEDQQNLQQLYLKQNVSIKFYNKQVDSLFQQLLTQHSTISEMNRYLSLPNLKNQATLQLKDIQEIKCKIIKKNDKNVNIKTNIFELIINDDKDIYIGEDNCNEYLILIRLQSSNPLELQESNKFLKIKVSSCTWENSLCQLVLIEDFTLQMEFEQLRNQSDYKDLMLATVTHDLKTPINGITAQIQSVEKSQDPVTLHKVLDIVQINVQLLLFLVFDIQDYSQIKKNIIKVVPKQFKVQDAVKQCLELITMQAGLKQLNLLEDFNLTQEQSLVFNDEVRFKQIMLNLLGNSLKCTSRGYIKVKTEFKMFNDTIKITVADTGIGMSQEVKKKLFMLYSAGQEDEHQHSVGLGLAITKTLADLIGPKNSLKVTSEEGLGCEFSFEIHRSLEYRSSRKKSKKKKDSFMCKSDQIIERNSPNIYKSDDSQQQSPDLFQLSYSNIQSKMGIQQDFFFEDCQEMPYVNIVMSQQFKLKNGLPYSNYQKKLKILIADDDIFCIMAFKTLCQQLAEKIDIIHAFNGLEAIDQCQKQQFDIVFLDYNMPGMNGGDAALKIKQTYPQLQIYFLSGNEFSNNLNNMKEQAYKFKNIKKPISKEEIVELIENHILSKGKQ